jgi:hypothetical protein
MFVGEVWHSQNTARAEGGQCSSRSVTRHYMRASPQPQTNDTAKDKTSPRRRSKQISTARHPHVRDTLQQIRASQDMESRCTEPTDVPVELCVVLQVVDARVVLAEANDHLCSKRHRPRR